jgi:hypothetical protein
MLLERGEIGVLGGVGQLDDVASIGAVQSLDRPCIQRRVRFDQVGGVDRVADLVLQLQAATSSLKASTWLRSSTPSISRIRAARSKVMPWYSFRSSRETCDS